MFDLLTATAWPDQPIGRPILGTREGVGAFDRDAIDRYLAPPLQRRRDRGRRRRRGRARRDRRARRSPGSTGCLPRPRRPQRRPSIAAARRGSAGVSSRPMSWSGSRAGRSARRITTPPRSSPPRPAAACRRGSSRRCARSAASPIRSIAFHWDYSRHRPVRLLRRLGRPGRGGGGRRLARLPRRGRARARRSGNPPRQGADEGLAGHRARIARRRAPSSSRARCRSTGARFRSTR